MTTLSALELARAQFGFTVSFHIIFPAITIGLASYLAVLEGLWLWKKEQAYRNLYHFWSKIFAVNFGMGVVSGLVMAYQFGTNWGFFSTFAGSITGPLLTYEVLTAFFLEAGFLGVMLFGWGRVSPRLHYFATVMVAIGTLISATWILASNSWMQTPQGHAIVNGHVVPVDWFEVIFNPSFPYRLVHMVIAAYLCTALMVGATGAWHLLKNKQTQANRLMLSMAMWMLFIAMPLQVLVGDAHGLNTLEYQPTKLAAIEAHWENEPGEAVPLILFAWPDNTAEKNHFELSIPHLASLILTHSWDGQIPALKDVAPTDRPNVTAVFWSFRIMVGIGILILLLSLWALWLRYRDALYHNRTFLRGTLLMGPMGLIALLAGWITTEMGRQPWVVYGLMRTTDAVTPHSFATILTTFIVITLIYIGIFGSGIRYLIRMAGQGPTEYESQDEPIPTPTWSLSTHTRAHSSSLNPVSTSTSSNHDLNDQEEHP